MTVKIFSVNKLGFKDETTDFIIFGFYFKFAELFGFNFEFIMMKRNIRYIIMKQLNYCKVYKDVKQYKLYHYFFFTILTSV